LDDIDLVLFVFCNEKEKVYNPIFNGRLLEQLSSGPPVVIKYRLNVINSSLKLKYELHSLADAPEPLANHVALAAEPFHAVVDHVEFRNCM
jgi:hypothetical protein